LKQDWENNPQLQCWKSFWKKVRGNSMLEFEDKFCIVLPFFFCCSASMSRNHQKIAIMCTVR
jgi:hypothetical protein